MAMYYCVIDVFLDASECNPLYVSLNINSMFSFDHII